MADTTFGAYLKQRMNELDTNAYRVAQATGFQPGTISHWINNRRLPNPESCAILAEALALDIDDVLERAGHRPRYRTDPDPARAEIYRMVDQLPEDELELVRSLIRWRLSEARTLPVQPVIRRRGR